MLFFYFVGFKCLKGGVGVWATSVQCVNRHTYIIKDLNDVIRRALSSFACYFQSMECSVTE